MEIQFKSRQHNLLNQFQELLSPFLNQPKSSQENTLMAIHDLEKKLHHHFVTKEPLWVTYEYYNDNDVLCFTEEFVFVESVSIEQQFHFSTVNTNLHFGLHSYQILSVSANIAA